MLSQIEHQSKINKLNQDEKECFSFINMITKTLNHFICDDFFKVAYRNKDTKSAKVEPNGATSIIIRIMQNCDDIANMISSDPEMNRPMWNNLKQHSEKSLTKLSDNKKSYEVLPLKTFGILPHFTSSYLAEIFGATSKKAENAEYKEVIDAYAFVMRKIFYLIDDMRSESGSDIPHPYIWYRFTRAITKFKNMHEIFKEEEKEVFYKKMNDKGSFEKILVKNRYNNKKYEKTLFKKLLKELSKEDKDYLMNWNVFTKKIEAKKIKDEIITEGLALLIKKASEEIAIQITRNTIKAGPEMDPSAVAFSLGVLAIDDKEEHSNLIEEGLELVFKSSVNGQWLTGMPFFSDDKGRAIFVSSVEIANVCMRVYLERFDRNLKKIQYKTAVPSIELILDATEKIQRKLCDNINIIEVKKEEGSSELIQLKGWCTDKAPSHNRIDSWVNIHALAFFMRRISLIRHVKKLLILDKYSSIRWAECKPMWDLIPDPDEGFAREGLRIKDLIEQHISERTKSPIFLLYGPPGTAKTTLVNSLAHKKQWDLVILSPSDFIVDGIDKVEINSRDIFFDLTNLDDCIVLFDEMDSLFRDREQLFNKNSPIEHVVPAFLPKLQRLRDSVKTKNMGVFIITNYYETMDRALLRGGRIDHHLMVLPYSVKAKKSLMKEMLCTKCKEGVGENANNLVDKIIEKCPPFLVYREIESIVDHLINNKQVVNYLKGKNSDLEEELNSIISDMGENIISPTITPELYDKTKRKGAFCEVCALLNRMIDQNCIDFSSHDEKRAIKYIKSNFDKIEESPWKDFFESWTKPTNVANIK